MSGNEAVNANIMMKTIAERLIVSSFDRTSIAARNAQTALAYEPISVPVEVGHRFGERSQGRAMSWQSGDHDGAHDDDQGSC